MAKRFRHVRATVQTAALLALLKEFVREQRCFGQESLDERRTRDDEDRIYLLYKERFRFGQHVPVEIQGLAVIKVNVCSARHKRHVTGRNPSSRVLCARTQVADGGRHRDLRYPYEQANRRHPVNDTRLGQATESVRALAMHKSGVTASTQQLSSSRSEEEQSFKVRGGTNAIPGGKATSTMSSPGRMNGNNKLSNVVPRKTIRATQSINALALRWQQETGSKNAGSAAIVYRPGTLAGQARSRKKTP